MSRYKSKFNLCTPGYIGITNWALSEILFFLAVEDCTLRSQGEHPRGGHFNLWLTPRRGWVGVKPAKSGVFLVQSGNFLVALKFIYLNLVSNIWILAPYVWVLALHIWILPLYIWILAPKLKIDSFRRVWGGGRVDLREKVHPPPGPPGGLVIGVWKKYSAHPLGISFSRKGLPACPRRGHIFDLVN